MLVRKKAAVAVPPSFSVPRGARLSTQEAFGRLLDDIAASEAALAGHAAKLRGRHAENANPEGPQLELRQIPFADMMILNKVDLVSAEQAKKVRAWIDGHFSSLRMVEASYRDVPLEILLSVGRFDPARTDLDLRD